VVLEQFLDAFFNTPLHYRANVIGWLSVLCWILKYTLYEKNIYCIKIYFVNDYWYFGFIIKTSLLLDF
jgi:hypothetical protein